MSISTMIQFGDGTYKMGGPELWNSIVDVRDVASDHIKAGFAPTASGRHILVSGEARLLDIANILRKHFGEGFPYYQSNVKRVHTAPRASIMPNTISIGCAFFVRTSTIKLRNAKNLPYTVAQYIGIIL